MKQRSINYHDHPSLQGSPYRYELEKLAEFDKKLGTVSQLSEEEIRSEAMGYLGDCEYRCWPSIESDRGKLLDPSLDKDGNVSASSAHSEHEVLQAIVCIERWRAARRSAGARRGAVTRKRNAQMMQQLSELCRETKRPTKEQLIAALTVE